MEQNHTSTVRVFVAYSRSDAKLCDEFCLLLKGWLGGAIDIFRDRAAPGIADGTIDLGDWFAHLSLELRARDYVIGLVSRAYLRSPWLWAELVGARMFEKQVIPVLIPPITPKHLPLPLSSVRVYDINREDLADLQTRLRALVGLETNSSLSSIDNFMSSLEPAFANDTVLPVMPEDERVEFHQILEDYRNTMGEWLEKQLSQHKSELDYDVVIHFDLNGNAHIERTETITAITPVAHTYYHLYIDAPGIIRMVSLHEVTSGETVSYVTSRKTDTSSHFTVLLPHILMPGERVTLKYVLEAENYISDLFKNGRGWLTFSIPRKISVTSHRVRVVFPDVPAIRTLTARLVESRSDRQEGQILQYTVTADGLMYEVNLGGEDALRFGRDAFEFTLPTS